MIYIRSFYEDAIDAAVSRFLKKVGKNPTVTHVCFANKHLFNNKNNVCKIPAEILLWICRNSYVTFQSKSVLFIIYLQSHLNNILRCYKGIHPSSVSHLPMCNHDYLCSSAWNRIWYICFQENLITHWQKCITNLYKNLTYLTYFWPMFPFYAP